MQIQLNTLLLGLYASTAMAHPTLDAEKVLELNISNTGITRLSVDQERIEDVFIYPVEYEEHLQLHKSGHLFIVAPGIKTPLYLSLVTASGQTQDIRLHPSSLKSPTPLILKAGSSQNPQEEKKDQIRQWLKTFVEGKIPKDFTKTSFSFAGRIYKGIKATPACAYRGDHYLVLVYEVKPEESEEGPYLLSSNHFSKEGDVAVVFDRKVATSKQSAHLYVVQPLKY